MQSIAQHEITSSLENSSDDNAVRRALEEHHGNAHAAIAALLADCGHLRGQLALASRMMGYGYSRGWVPDPDRLPHPPQDGGH
ncbi:hypothetical protein MUO32_06490 [Shinella sp. CPCC 101442]|uniref:hypothetical protein n=1 Tax=Shinella sp. CPCC 101442 TaxID=2932265 RepID=UPI00215230BD|nr:hypothetical protein [Shinella sp. CPCC 101442]MCR6498669.1 hypothetical protein [Shinella sp. CPCC 101442]